MADLKNLGVRLDEDFHRELKVQAIREGRHLADLVADALRQYLNRRRGIDNRKAAS